MPTYIDWLRAGKVIANQTLEIVFENDAIAVVDGQFGFGQVMGEEAMKLGIESASARAWPWWRCGTRATWAGSATGPRWRPRPAWSRCTSSTRAAAGFSSRPSEEPSAGFRPTRSRRAFRSQNGPPIIVDISTCTIAEGKIKVAFNKGAKVPDGCILDGEGRPTDDPKAFYASPPGAILPLGGHKGYGLSVLAEVLAGCLTGGACSHFGVDRVANNMLSIILDPAVFSIRRRVFRGDPRPSSITSRARGP